MRRRSDRSELPGNVIVVPIEIRPGVFVRIAGIPHNLTKAEAEKIGAVIIAMGARPATPEPEDTRHAG